MQLLHSGLIAAAAALSASAVLASDDVHSRAAYTGPLSDGGEWKSGFAQAKALLAQMARNV